MIISEQELQDFKQQYAGTVVRFNTADIVMPFYIEQVVRSRSLTKLVVTGEVGKIDNVWQPAKHEVVNNVFNFSYPQLGAINIDNYAVYITRAPVRQWKKGLIEDTLSNFNYSKNDLVGLKVDSTGFFSPKFLYYWFNTHYPSPREAITKLNNGEYLSIAINPHFVIANHLMSKATVIYYKTYKVGIVKDNKILLMRNNEHLINELEEYFPVILQ